MRNRKFGVEELGKKTQTDGYFFIFLRDNVGAKGSIFEKEDDRISTDRTSVIRFYLRNMFKSKICFKLHIISNFDNWIFIEDVSYL